MIQKRYNGTVSRADLNLQHFNNTTVIEKLDENKGKLPRTANFIKELNIYVYEGSKKQKE